MWKKARVTISTSGVLYVKYLELKKDRTNMLKDNNINDNNLDIAQTKTKPLLLKKQKGKRLKSTIKKH